MTDVLQLLLVWWFPVAGVTAVCIGMYLGREER